MPSFVMSSMPTVQLSNGLIVGNFSSGHTFTFQDGSILPACEHDRVALGRVDPIEHETHSAFGNVAVTLVRLSPQINGNTLAMLDDADEYAKDGRVQVILVSLMLLEAIRLERTVCGQPGRWGRCFAIRRVGRSTKDRPARICIDRFCE